MKKKADAIKHHMDTLAALLLFGVFAVCVLAVLLTGADAYRRLTERDREAYDRRSCVQYIATRVRQSDAAGGIGVEPFGDTTALVLGEGDFVTRVYCYEGYIMEPYCAAGDTELTPRDGERVMEADSMDAYLTDGLLQIIVVDPNYQYDSMVLSLRSGEGGAA